MNWNKYDIIIIVCIAAIAWGGLDILNAFLPIRLIGLYGYYHVFTSHSIHNVDNLRKWKIVFVFIVIYTILSLVWAPHIDFKTEIIHTIHIVLIFGVFLLLQECSVKAHNPFNALILGWAVMVALTVPIALWELITNNHLKSSVKDEMHLSFGIIRLFAAVTFGNVNSYSVVLCFSLPFLLVSWMKDVPFRMIVRALSIIVIGIILINSSRGCVLCVLIAVIIFLLLNSFHKDSLTKSIGLIFIMGASVWVAIDYFRLDLFFQLMDRIDTFGAETNREDVYKAGLEIAENYFFMGSGVATIIPLLTKYYHSLQIHVTHNFYLEILIEYGIIIFLLLFGRFYLSTFKLIKSKLLEFRYIGAYMLLSSPVLFLIDDYYSGESAIWLYLFSLMIIEAVSIRLKERKC